MDCSLSSFSVHGILLARILEWVAMLSSRGSSRTRDQAHISNIAGGFFNTWETLCLHWESPTWKHIHVYLIWWTAALKVTKSVPLGTYNTPWYIFSQRLIIGNKGSISRENRKKEVSYSPISTILQALSPASRTFRLLLQTKEFSEGYLRGNDMLWWYMLALHSFKSNDWELPIFPVYILNYINLFIFKNFYGHTDIVNRLVYTRGEGEDGTNWESRVKHFHYHMENR